MSKRVLFVEPTGVRDNVFATYLGLPLLGPLYLGTLLDRAGYQVRVINENLYGGEVTDQDLRQADWLGLSLLTPTAKRGYALARRYRAVNPRGRVIIGGIHPSFATEEAAEVADHVVVGEAENVLVDLLRHGGGPIVQGEPVQDLDRLPLINLSLLEGAERMLVDPAMTSRGCPHQCTFCSVTEMFGRHYRMASVDRMIEEVKRSPRRSLFFYDDNFAASPRRTHAFVDEMLRQDLRTEWVTQVRADLTRDEALVKKMRRAGCTRAYVGFESINPATLESMQKKLDVSQIERAITVFHRAGIDLHGMFIFGNDTDSVETFAETVRFTKRMGLASVQYMILTPLPGTRTFEALDQAGRLLHKNWELYDAMHVVHRPRGMTPRQLQEHTLRAYENFYDLGGIVTDALAAAWEGARGLVQRVLFVHGHSRARFKNAVIKTMARGIIGRWTRANRDFVRTLESDGPPHA